MGQLDLQTAFRSRRPFSENLEDQARTVDDLALGFFLQRLLLNGAQGRIDDEELGALSFRELRNFFDLAFSKQACRSNLPKFEAFTANDVDPDGPGQASRFLNPGIERAQHPLSDPFGHDNQRALAPRYAAVISTIENAQSSSSAWLSPARFNA
jgi:hypothetical protein